MNNQNCSGHELLSTTARDHALHPRRLGPLEEYNGHARVTGPCGDTMEFWVWVENGCIAEVSFVTDGCGPSVACGSMTLCLVEGKAVQEVLALKQRDVLNALGGLPDEHEHCALLAANTIKEACKQYMDEMRSSASDACGAGAACDSCYREDCSAATRRKGESAEEFASRQLLEARMCRIRHKIVVLSGKGGVGKSTVAVTLATALMLAGKRVGLLDVDIHGPSIPVMLGLEGQTPESSDEGLLPIELGDLKIMSLGFLLTNPDDAVVWRGPMKMGVIQQFLKDVAWGDLDYLIVDSPPGTGDEPLSVCQLIQGLDGAVIVTTPQRVAAVDVRKSITFCRQLHVPVLGVVENMSGFVCPKCGELTQILPAGGGRRIAEDMGVPFLGAIPMDPGIAAAGDKGRAYIHESANSPTAAMMRDIVRPIAVLDENDSITD